MSANVSTSAQTAVAEEALEAATELLVAADLAADLAEQEQEAYAKKVATFSALAEAQALWAEAEGLKAASDVAWKKYLELTE